MNYFITLNVKSDMSYEYLIKEIEKTSIDILGIEAVTEWKDSSISAESYENAKKAFNNHKKKLRF
ncbi:MAG: hypothetical protein K6A97_00125 [Lachnospiraceae bacterium]|nr:hypothetical protein [Lachnospiraceae bacterium]